MTCWSFNTDHGLVLTVHLSKLKVIICQDGEFSGVVQTLTFRCCTICTRHNFKSIFSNLLLHMVGHNEVFGHNIIVG